MTKIIFGNRVKKSFISNLIVISALMFGVFSTSSAYAAYKVDISNANHLDKKTTKVSQEYCRKYQFNENQKKVLKASYILGSKYGLGYSLAAIAWKESLAGEYLINVNDPSFGVHHILIDTAAKRAKVKGIDINKLAMSIMGDIKLSASFAVQELLFWKSELEGKEKTWNNIWAAYNGGYRYDKKVPQEYSKDIKSKISWLSQCMINKRR